jgi:hypothetical protein
MIAGLLAAMIVALSRIVVPTVRSVVVRLIQHMIVSLSTV